MNQIVESATNEVTRLIASEVETQLRAYLAIPGHEREKQLVELCEAANRENARLREALAYYANKHSDFCASWNYPPLEVERYCDCIDTRNARAALEGKR